MHGYGSLQAKRGAKILEVWSAAENG